MLTMTWEIVDSVSMSFDVEERPFGVGMGVCGAR